MSSVVTIIRGMWSHGIMPSDMIITKDEKYLRTRRGEMFDPSIVMAKWALRSVVMAKMSNIDSSYLELLVFFSASVDVIVSIFLLFL